MTRRASCIPGRRRDSRRSLFEPFVSATPHEHLRALSESLNAERRT
ncbi:MAG: hypothetical protein R2789_18330 [Microthrixaceae bacterium]